MRRALVVLGWLVFAALGQSCAGGDDGTATSPINPFTFGNEPAPVTGSEPSGADNEAPARGGGSIEELCARACANLQSMCPAPSGGGCDAASCASINTMGCDAEFKAFVACIGVSPLICQGGSINAPACDAAGSAFDICARSSAASGSP